MPDDDGEGEMDPVPESTITHFQTIPFARKTLDDAAFKIVPQSRTVTHSGHGHTLMGKTWNTATTITQLVTLFRPSKSPSPLHFPQPEPLRAETHRFYTFGPDLNAHPDLLHGGVISCILDSSLGGVIGMALRAQPGGPPVFTVQLNVAFKAPVRTPGTVRVRAWVVKVGHGGRKAWAEGVMEGEDGRVHARAEGMWVRPRARM